MKECDQRRRGCRFSARVEECLSLRAQRHVDATKPTSNHLAVAASSMGGPSPLPTMTFIPALGTPSTTT